MRIDPAARRSPGVPFRGKGDPRANEPVTGACPIRLSAPMLAALLAVLLLVPAAERYRRADTGDHERISGSVPAAQQHGSPIAADGIAAGAENVDLRQPRNQAFDFTMHTPDSTGTFTIDDWMRLLYPQLVHIDELETRPAAAALVELLPMLDDADPAVRLAAVESLADLGREAPPAALAAALQDLDPQVRIAAIEGLSLHAGATATAAIEALVFDTDRRVRIAAIDALAIIEPPASLPLLGGLLYDPDPAIRSSALAALGDIGGARALRYLDPLRHDPDDKTRASASAILFEAKADSDY